MAGDWLPDAVSASGVIAGGWNSTHTTGHGTHRKLVLTIPRSPPPIVALATELIYATTGVALELKALPIGN